MIKFKAIAIGSTIALFLIFVTVQSIRIAIQKQKDYNRIVSNQAALTDSLTYYKDHSGREAAVSPVLEYKVGEVLKLLPEVQKQLEELKIKAGRVETFTETRIIQNKDIKQVLRDSIIINQQHLKVFKYRDPWYSISGIIQNDSASLHISSTDSIFQVVSYGKRIKPWLLFFSHRELIQTIQSRNPDNKIVYSRYIQIKK